MAEETTTESLTTDTAALSIETTDDVGLSDTTGAPKTPTTPSGKQDEPLTLSEEDEGERGKLESDVRAKDANISALEKLRQEKQQELDSLQKELDGERLLQMKESILHRIEVERLKRQTKAVEERLTVLEKDMQNKVRHEKSCPDAPMHLRYLQSRSWPWRTVFLSQDRAHDY